jgi:hypothetical protein
MCMCVCVFLLIIIILIIRSYFVFRKEIFFSIIIIIKQQNKKNLKAHNTLAYINNPTKRESNPLALSRSYVYVQICIGIAARILFFFLLLQ